MPVTPMIWVSGCSAVVGAAQHQIETTATLAQWGRALGQRGQSIVEHVNAVEQRFSGVRRLPGPGKRDMLSAVFGSLGLTRVLGAMRSAAVSDLRVLAYHRVLPQFDDSSYLFDAELVSARKEEFDWQMAYIARHFQPVSCKQVAEALGSGSPLPKRAVMVTFDDGFRDNYEVAFPVLRSHGVPALFFVSTGYIDSQSPYWFDWIVHVLLQTSATRIRLDALDVTIELGATSQTRRAAALQLLRMLKHIPESKRLELIEQLRHSTKVDMSAEALAQSAPMTWDQIREMAGAGMEFGSHTVSHPILSTITDPASLQLELEGSKAKLELEIGRPVIALAYPVGGPGAINDEVLASTRKAGYQIAFTYQSGTNRLSTCKRFMLKRVPVERYTSRHMFVAALQLPEIFGR